MTGDRHPCGIYPATVHDNSDPENRLRLRLKIPMLLGDGGVTEWALPCLPPNWRDGLVGAHSDHSFTDHNDGTGSSGNQTQTLAHDHNHVPISTVPVVGTSVWVMFIGGDIDFPVWLGTF